MTKRCPPRRQKTYQRHRYRTGREQHSRKERACATTDRHRRQTVEHVEHSERGERDMPKTQQPPAKRVVAAEKFLEVKSQTDRGAADEGRENQPPTGDEIERVRP